MRSVYGFLSTCAVLLAQACGTAGDQPVEHQEWKWYGGDSAGTKYSALEQINRDNVHWLEPAWVYRSGDMVREPATTIECNPIVVDGVMYVTSPALKLIALKAVSGERIWQFDPFEGQNPGGVNRGVTYWEDRQEKRIFFSAGPFLYSLDATTGKRVPSFGKEGRIDLRQGLDRDAHYLSVTATSPGIIYEDLLIMGSTVGEGPGPAAPGHVRAFDVRSGRQAWIFHTIPHPGEPGHETWPEGAWKTAGGANTWGGFTLDEQRQLVFFGTGSPSYDHFGGNRTGKNLFGNCVVALHAATGQRAWHFQVVHHDIWDYDIPCPPNLVTVQHAGKRIDAVAQATKMGHLFLLDRDTGRPLFGVEERPVPASEIPGETTWPTQPFPVKPPPYAQQTFTEAEVTRLSPRARKAVLERLQTMDTGSLFLPPSFRGSVALPQFNGGTDWGGAAFDPTSGVLYVNASNEAEWISMVEARPRTEMTLAELGSHLYQTHCTVCHGYDRTQESKLASNAVLGGLSQRRSEQEVLSLLKEGLGRMPSFAGLTSLEERALIAFLFETGIDERIGLDDLADGISTEIPYVATGHRILRDPEGFPANQRPWGTLNAIDLNEGNIIWQVALGTYPALEARGLPPTGTFNMGGPLVTAGGLVFIGATMDERFRAFDKETGEQLWEYQLDAGGYATPATFEIEGKQFVVIAAGGGGKPETRPGDAFYCFALP